MFLKAWGEKPSGRQEVLVDRNSGRQEHGIQGQENGVDVCRPCKNVHLPIHMVDI